MLTPREGQYDVGSIVYETVDEFYRLVAANPTRSRARNLLRQLRTGDSRIDRHVRELAQITFALALVRFRMQQRATAHSSSLDVTDNCCG